MSKISDDVAGLVSKQFEIAFSHHRGEFLYMLGVGQLAMSLGKYFENEANANSEEFDYEDFTNKCLIPLKNM